MDDAEKELRRIKAAFRRAFSSDSGHIVMKWLEDNFIFTTPYVPGKPDATQVNVGKQYLALEIRDLADPTKEE
ncbi:MAG: hypothetical protein ACREF4_13015 [Gammaproteobacteria bacterium]